MKKLIYLTALLLAALSMGACTKESPDLVDIPPEGRPQKVRFEITPDQFTVSTRATAEDWIGSVYLFLYDQDKNQLLARQVYRDNYGLYYDTEMWPGAYYMVAVCAADVRESDTLDQLMGYLQSTPELNPPYIPMGFIGDIVIPTHDNKDVRLSYTVPMTRAMAKVSLDVRFQGEAEGFSVRGVRAGNVPTHSRLLDTGLAPPDGASYYADHSKVLADDTGKYVFYMGENKQGNNPAILTPKDKHTANAPANATYVIVRVNTDNGYADYTVYLGENATDDFNVVRNTHYAYTITINGRAEDDLRVEVEKKSMATITYDPNGGWGGSSEQVAVGSMYSLPDALGAGVDNGSYPFSHWSTRPDNMGDYYNARQSIAVTGDLTLYAIWGEPHYEVNYYPNGGTGHYMDGMMGSGEYYVVDPWSAGISRPGYEFSHWTDGSGYQYYPGQSIILGGSMDFYAQWVPVYEVTYHANNGSGQTYTDSYPIWGGNNEYYLQSPQYLFSYPGHTFTGWNTNSDGTGQTYQPDAVVYLNGDMNLHAIWTLTP